jgi:hypothetical protein
MAQLLGTGKQRASKTSRVLVGATALTFSSWEAAMNYEDFPTTNFESFNVIKGESFDEGIGGTLGCDLRFGGDWDAGTNPLGPPGLFPRDDLASLSFFTSRLDAILWSFAFARLRSATNSAQIGQKVAFNCGGKSQGNFNFPTGSV